MKKENSVWSIILKVLLVCVFLTITVTSITVFILLYPSSKDVIKVPDLVGKDRISAIGILSRKRLGIKEVYSPHDTLPKDYVIAQNPLPGTEVKQKRRVEVTLSSGRSMVVVPSFCELALSEVKENLCRMESENYCGLQVRSISYTNSSIIPPNHIISHIPISGTRVPKNTSISLVVSSGSNSPVFYMPDLVNTPVTEAKKLLDEMGLNIEIKEEVAETIEQNMVINQSPLAGKKVSRGGTVTLTVSVYLSEGGVVPAAEEEEK
ncbi:MAG: PASTA domain-containing protein [bacterium]